MRIGFIGLGVMGTPMALNLCRLEGKKHRVGVRKTVVQRHVDIDAHPVSLKLNISGNTVSAPCPDLCNTIEGNGTGSVGDVNHRMLILRFDFNRGMCFGGGGTAN